MIGEIFGDDNEDFWRLYVMCVEDDCDVCRQLV
jgi:hypothetical protein